jgi:hypothetical protein
MCKPIGNAIAQLCGMAKRYINAKTDQLNLTNETTNFKKAVNQILVELSGYFNYISYVMNKFNIDIAAYSNIRVINATNTTLIIAVPKHNIYTDLHSPHLRLLVQRLNGELPRFIAYLQAYYPPDHLNRCYPYIRRIRFLDAADNSVEIVITIEVI